MHTDHIVNQINHHELKSDSTLHVIGVISNPARFHSRYRLFREWQEAMLKTNNVKLYVVEAAYGDRLHEITDSNNPQHLQLRTKQEIWHKENMINLGEERLLPKDWKYLAWIDCDVLFDNSNWALEAIHKLQHYPVIQPWSECVDLGAYGNTLQLFKSFAQLSHRGIKQQTHKDQPYPYGHSGFGWACTREFWEQVKGLIDFAILGSGDHHMAWAMVGSVDWSIHGGMSEPFKRRCHEWQARALRITNKNIGYVPGTIRHKFHGPKNKRLYRERWQILVDNKFNPDIDLMYDYQGMVRLVGKPQLEHEIKLYNLGREEDSIQEY